MVNIHEVRVQGQRYRVVLERRIVAGKRSVHALAYNDGGEIVLSEEVNSISARPYLENADEAASWAELERIVLQNVALNLEE